MFKDCDALPVLLLHTLSVHTGLGGAVVRARVAQGAMGARRAQALEAVHLVLAFSTAEAGTGAALVNVHFTLLPCEAQYARAHTHT